MDFQTMKRRDLQALCKLNSVPANSTNAAMADALASLSTVEGLEEILRKPETEGSPERSVITTPAVPRTTTRSNALKKELECSKLGTRTRGGTIRTRAVEGTNIRKTTATRTTQKRASQVATARKGMQKDLQAEFDADLQLSEISENSVLGPEIKEIAEEASGISVVNEGQSLSENQSEAQNELQPVNEGEEVIDSDDLVVDEARKVPSESEKVDFHSLNRKDLQNLCKKNKIPANMTNAAMADALASLEVVEGLQEFMMNYDPQALSSPFPVSGISKSCARQSRTTLKITKDPLSSKQITKSCRVSRRRILEETEQAKNDVPEISAAQTPCGSALCESESIQDNEDSGAPPKCDLKKLEISSMDEIECPAVFSNCQDGVESSKVSRVGEFNSNLDNSLMQEATVNESTLEDAYGKDNDNLLGIGLEGSVPKMDENIVQESSEDAEVFIAVKPPLAASCAIQLENLKLCSEEIGLEDAQVQKLETFEIASDNESDGPQLENLANVPLLSVEDQISEEFVSNSTTRVDQLLDEETVEEFNDSELKNLENTPDASKDQISKDFVSDSTTNVDPLLNLEFNEHSTSGNKKLESFISTAQSIPVELEQRNHADDELPEKSFPASTVQADEVILKSGGENESDSICADDASENCDCEGNYPSLLEKADIKTTAEVDNKVLEINGVSKSEDSGAEDDMSENFDISDSELDSDDNEESDIEATIKADKLLDVESESEDTDIETTSEADDELLDISGESKSVDSGAEDDMSENFGKSDSETEFNDTEEDMSEKSDIEEVENFDLESMYQGYQEITVDIETQRNQHEKLSLDVEIESDDSCTEVENFDFDSISPGDEEITIDIESKRKKHEKLDTASDFATGLTNDDSCVPTKKVETPLQGKSMRQLKRILKAKLQAAELQALANSMDNLNLDDTEKPLLKVEDLQQPEEDSKNDKINDSSENEVITSDVKATTLRSVDDEVIPEDVITGDTNVDTDLQQQTPTKLQSKNQTGSFLFTPPSKKLSSAGRTNCVSDVNKENIDNSAASTITESEKLLSMSIGKLRKEVKVLQQQQSEKKRQALQSRSENLLASP